MTRILIIEDDEDFASILQECLEEEPDLEIVRVINNENDALQFIRSEEFAGIHCVLQDLRLPRAAHDSTVSASAGIRLLQEMRQTANFYGTVIILTSSRDAEDGKRALTSGCDGYLCKNTRTADMLTMLNELKVAIRGQVILVSNEMRHVFFRNEISPKEARLMELLSHGKSWSKIASELGYSTSKAAANIADRIFDKILSSSDRKLMEESGAKKREKAMEVWNLRYMSPRSS
ncbi:MAG: response regulator [Cyanobacteria bacterium SZAS-4]|nr:response regulator [Cyanobacteria bacterium SZAS-4]